jgi:hypothetical protein
MMLKEMQKFAKHMHGTYVAFQVDALSAAKLDHFCQTRLGLGHDRVHASKYHTTVIYSRSPVPDADDLSSQTSAWGKAIGYDIFQTNGERCLVMLVECEDATNLNAALGRRGATSDFPTYNAHITLSYAFSGDERELPLPDFRITYDRVVVEPLDPLHVD